MQQLFELQEGDKFTVRLYPMEFTVINPFKDTIGPVEVQAEGTYGVALLGAMTEVNKI